MRTNSPTDSGFRDDILNPPEEQAQSKEPTAEMKRLAKAAKSPDGKIIIEHLKQKIDEYTTRLKTEDFAAHPDHMTSLATAMCYQKMINEFEVVLNDVEISTKTVADSAKQRARA